MYSRIHNSCWLGFSMLSYFMGNLCDVVSTYNSGLKIALKYSSDLLCEGTILGYVIYEEKLYKKECTELYTIISLETYVSNLSRLFCKNDYTTRQMAVRAGLEPKTHSA